MAHSDPERVLSAQIAGVARHLVCDGLDTPEQWAAAVEELRLLARGRVDLLAELAGVSLGVGESQLDADRYRETADLCPRTGQIRSRSRAGSGWAGAAPSMRRSHPALERSGDDDSGWRAAQPTHCQVQGPLIWNACGAIVKTCGSRFLGSFGLGVLFAGSFDEFAVDEGRSGADQGDEVGRVDGAPAVLG